MAKAKMGDRVLVHYTGWLAEEGTEFDTSRNGDPLEFEAGSQDVIPGVSEAVVGMGEGESLEVTVPPEKGYGVVEDALRVEVSRTELPEGIEPREGMRLAGRVEGRPFSVTIREVGEETVVLDGNHPLAGRSLRFEIELVEILAD